MSKIVRMINNLKKKPVSAIIDGNIYSKRENSYAGNSIADKSIRIIDFTHNYNTESMSEEICNYFKAKVLNVSVYSYKDKMNNQTAIFPETILINLIYVDNDFQMVDLYSKVQDEVKYLKKIDGTSQIVFLTMCTDDAENMHVLLTVRNFTKGLSSVLFRHGIMVRGISCCGHLPFEKMGGALSL